MIAKLLATGQGEWLKGEGAHGGIVISTRVRLARNVSPFPFSTKIDNDQSEELLGFLKDQALQVPESDFLYADLRQLDEIDRLVLVERHLISKEHAARKGPRE